jgi:hypothetical protein
LIYQCIGFDGIELPNDWVWRRRGIGETASQP